MLLSGKTQKKHLGDLPPTVPHLYSSTLGDSGLPIAAITAWNGLPSTITTSTSLPTLRCEPSNFDLVSTEFSYKYTWTPCDFVKYCCNVFYPHMPIGNAWIYREYCLFFSFVFVRLRISPLRIKLAVSNFVRWFIGVMGRESHILGNSAPPKAQNRPAHALNCKQNWKAPSLVCRPRLTKISATFYL